MPVQLQDAVVVANLSCSLIASQPLPYQPPFTLDPAAGASPVAPWVLPPLPAEALLAPGMLAAVAQTTIAAPDVLAAIAQTAIANPVAIPTQAVAGMLAPVALAVVAAAGVTAPDVLTVVSAPEVSAPDVLTVVSAPEVSAPDVLTVVSAPEVSAPDVLTPIAYSDSPPFPLSHSRILYNNLLAGASVAVSGGTGGSNLLNPATYNRWEVTIGSGSSASATFTLPTSTSLDCVGVAAHNIGSLGGTGQTIRCEYATTVGGSFFEFATLQVRQAGDNRAMMFIRETPVTVRQVRIRLTSIVGTVTIGVIQAGIALQMQRPIYGGHSPITLSRVTDYFTNKSEAGEWLGRQIRRRGLEGTAAYANLKADWYRQYFDPFVESASNAPFFYAWRPDDYPNEVAYCWTDSDISPSNTGGGRDTMSVTIPLKAHA